MREVYTCVANWAWSCPNSLLCDSLLNSTVLRPWKDVLCSSTLHHSWPEPFPCISKDLFSSFIHVNLGSDNHLIWVLTTCILGYLTQPREENHRRGRPEVTIELKGREGCSTQKMEITDFSNTLAPINQTTWCHVLEDHNINSNYCDNLGSHRVHNNV